MADAKPQSFANHGRLDPPFHMFLLPLGLAAIIVSVIFLIRRPGIDSVLAVIFAIGFVMIAEKASDMIRGHKPLPREDHPVWIHPAWEVAQR